MSLEETVLGIQKVVNSNMIRAIRLTLAKRGLDPRDFALVAYGGAGPMHACNLAKEMGIRKVLIPFLPGAFSAYGILISDINLSYSKSLLVPLDGSDSKIDELLRDLRELARADLEKQGIVSKSAHIHPSLDLRYKGQSYEINVDFTGNLTEEFHKKHEQIYGYAMDTEPLELVNVRLFVVHNRKKSLPRVSKTGSDKAKGERLVYFEDGPIQTNIFSRDDLKSGFEGHGPAIVEEKTATTVIPPGIPFNVNRFGVIEMEVS
jgi:N-methylhydantoinase A